MKTKLCILTALLVIGTTPAFAAIYTLNPVDISLPTYSDPSDGISRIGSEQAWFAFDLSSIPAAESIVSASFSAYMRDFGDGSHQRTLWYDSDDSWIVTTTPNTSDPGNSPADFIIGTVMHSNLANTWTTINITHDWTSDMADDYVTLMLTGPSGGGWAFGSVGLIQSIPYGLLEAPELTLTTIPAPGAILLGGLGVSIVGWMRRRRTL